MSFMSFGILLQSYEKKNKTLSSIVSFIVDLLHFYSTFI